MLDTAPQEDHGGDSGWHYVDQQRFSIDEARPLSVKKGEPLFVVQIFPKEKEL